MGAKDAVEQTPDLAAAIMALAQSMGTQQTKMADALALLQANQMPREIKEGDPEYTERLKAEGFYDEFPHPVIQNGYEAQARGLSKEVRERAGNLKTGRYLGGRVTVDVDSRGAVHIKYPNSKVDDRFKNLALWMDFEDLVNKIWAEMSAVAA